MRTLWLFSLLLLVLAGCVPATNTERARVESAPEDVSYYPHETGAYWEYLPSGARLSDPAVEVMVEGPTIIDDTVATAWSTFGRGRIATHFRIHTGEEQRLWREYRPGVIIDFDPPMLEYPTGPLTSNRTWSGETTVRVYEDRLSETASSIVGKTLMQTYTVKYTTTVVETRTVTVPLGEIEVFVLNHIAEHVNEAGEVIDRVSLITWFSPYLGEVRSDAGLLLTHTNVPAPQVKREGE